MSGWSERIRPFRPLRRKVSFKYPDILFNFAMEILTKINQNIEITFKFTKEITLKISKFWGKHERKTCIFLWWLDVFFLHTPISELTVYPSYTRPKGLAALGNSHLDDLKWGGLKPELGVPKLQ